LTATRIKEADWQAVSIDLGKRYADVGGYVAYSQVQVSRW